MPVQPTAACGGTTIPEESTTMPFQVHSSVQDYEITAKADEWRAEGISAEHAQAFLRVSHDTDCIILTRTPGEAALTLLAEGYDAKGFHVKAKSCDWGPWAGFICAEPRFNKSGMGGAYGNMSAHIDSLTKDFEALQNADRKARGQPVEGPYTCSVVAVELSDARVRWLEQQGKIPKAAADATERSGKAALGKDGGTVEWLLRRDAKLGRWRVYYKPAGLPPIPDTRGDAQKYAATVPAFEAALRAAAAKIVVPAVEGYSPVLALTNPYQAYKAPGEAHKNALTGDFDLFAVWPKLDRRAPFTVRVGGMGSGAAVAEEKNAIYKAEGEDLIGSTTGNISAGVYDVAVRLNIESQKIAGQSQVNRVFHSDEGGRPGMESVDESVAFVATGPAEGHMLLLKHPIARGSGEAQANAKALAAFALCCASQGYAIFLNTGWTGPMKQALGDGAWAELGKSVFKQEAQPAPVAPSAQAPAASAKKA
jgi:hypothetical protein